MLGDGTVLSANKHTYISYSIVILCSRDYEGFAFSH